MRFTTVIAAGILALASRTFASPTEVIGSPAVLIDTPPTAEPGTSPFPSSLMFDTTAPSSFVSAVSSYISSESVAITSLLSSLLSPTPAPSSPVTTATATSPSTTVPTATTATATSTTLSPTATGAAERSRSLVGISIVASVVLGTVVASL